MSRIAKSPINVPANVIIKINGQTVTVKSENSKLTRTFHKSVKIAYLNGILTLKPNKNYADSWAQAGTVRALLNAMIIGVTIGFSKKLQLVGVGYRAIVKNNVISLSLGFSHPVEYQLPADITVECPSQTEIILKGADKQMVGQVAANLRSYRPPEVYKGKGIRYIDEVVNVKNTKKK